MSRKAAARISTVRPVAGRRTLNRVCGLCFAAAILGAGPPRARAGEADELPRLSTNQGYIEDVMRVSPLDVADPMATFAYVLGRLPNRVKVYPTENYYYFSFIHNAVRYAGNIRLDASTRDQGKVHFGYYKDLAEWKDEEQVTYAVLDGTRGVQVEKLDRLVYRVSFRDKSVAFELNDLSQVIPPDGVLSPDERYIGPVADESGVRFFLVYNGRLKLFHYLLDETVRADEYDRTVASDRILIGKRTGFAFYRDHKRPRKILIGVFEANSRVNNYFDGPFDQLPDNFIEGESLRSAILEVQPNLAGLIDRFGGSPEGNDRYMIAPYMHYRTEEDLLAFDVCTRNPRLPASLYYACFLHDPQPAEPAASQASAPAAARKKARKSTRAAVRR
jgi:hypothetical protein